MKGGGERKEKPEDREIAYLRERLRELEDLLRQSQSQAEEWREVSRVVRALFEDYDGIILVIEPHGRAGRFRLINANHRLCRMLGRERLSVLGKSPSRLVAPAGRRRLTAALRGALELGSRYLETELLAEDGSIIPVEMTLIPYTIRGWRRVLCLGRDISMRRAAEEALRSSEELYRMLVENINDVIFSIDTSGEFTYISPVIERVSGYRPEEVVGRNLSDFMDPEEHRDLISRLTFDENGWHPPMEFRVRDKGGGYRYVRSSGRLMDRGGGAVEITGNMIDLTERRRTELALRESEERYRAVFEASGTAMCIVDEDGSINQANQEFRRMTGHRTGSGGRPRKLEAMMHPDDREGFRLALRGLSEDAGPVHLQFRLMRRGGRREEVQVRANMARIPVSGTAIVSMLDVTREWAYEKTLEENARRLRDFLSVASHELRHPLAIIKGYAQVLEEMDEGMPPEKRRAALRSMQQNLERLGLLGEELLDVSLIEERRFTARRRLLDASRLVDEVLEEMAGRGWEQELRADLDEGVRRMKADRGMLKRLLIILLENACKYSPPDSTVELLLQRMGGEAIISVLDRGPGVPPGQEELIFHRFYQGEEAAHHSKPGIGLGLYIARQIAEAHGGRIWYEARRGGGSAFRAALPQE